MTTTYHKYSYSIQYIYHYCHHIMYILPYFLYSEDNNIAITFYYFHMIYLWPVTMFLILMLHLVFSVSFRSLCFVILTTNEGL